MDDLNPDKLRPGHELDDDEVESTEWSYSDRAPDDFLVSGPVGEEGVGRGRWFPDDLEAARWVRERYGPRVRRRAPENEMEGLRWAYLIKSTNSRSRSS